jgi:hypothetical protein
VKTRRRRFSLRSTCEHRGQGRKTYRHLPKRLNLNRRRRLHSENITFENSAGPVGQALAIRVDGDRAVFRNCRFLGWQRHHILNRGVSTSKTVTSPGTSISSSVQQQLSSSAVTSIALRSGYITAASTYDYHPYGFVFSKCKITGESAEVKTYLGRSLARFFSGGLFENRDDGRRSTRRLAKLEFTGARRRRVMRSLIVQVRERIRKRASVVGQCEVASKEISQKASPE